MFDDDRPRPAGQTGELATRLASENLDPLSQDELEERIALLELEITRTRTHMDRVDKHRRAAEALFGSTEKPPA